MLKRIWALLDARERRRLVGIAPLLTLSALIEVVGVATVIPFLVVLTDPGSVSSVPLIGSMLDNLNLADAGALLRWVGVALALTLVLANALVIVTQWWMFRFSWSLFHGISSRLLKHHLSQPYSFITQQNSSTLTNRILVDVERLIRDGVGAALEIATRSFGVVAVVGFLVVLDPTTALLAFVVLGAAYSGIYLFTRGLLRRWGRELVRAGAARMKAVQEAFGGFKDLRVMGREGNALSMFSPAAHRYGVYQARTLAVAALPRYALEALAVGGLVVIASSTVGNPTASVGTLPLLGAYAFAGLRLLPSLQVLFAGFARLRVAAGVLESIEEDLRRTERLEPVLKAVPEALPFHESIELRNVTLTYPGAARPALAGVNLTIPRLSSLAIVGKTGSGKTTLVDVLLGLLHPQEGEVWVDGERVKSEQLRRYRALFGYVPQFIFLTDDTIARNVAFGVPDAEIDMKAVKRACEEAQIADFIEGELPNGYQTEVGERGVRLSGGQRQRIGIARALYGQPEVLVFDEATSALDTHTEAAVYRALDAIAEKRTVVTIAHRLETVKSAQSVVRLEGGVVVGVGQPSEVLV